MSGPKISVFSAAAAVGWRTQLLVFVIAAALVVSRRPDALFNAQFFAEDGSIWFPQAYMNGWFSALFHSQDGYFQTLPRLAAALALLVPLRFAPLLMNVIAIAFQVLPVNILLSERCRDWGSLWLRAGLAVVYIALPNTRELDAAMEEGQWHLALLACIVVLAAPPRKLAWRVFDLAVVLLCGLSGPFGVILFPIAVAFWWLRRDSWRLVLSAAIAVCAIVQLSALSQLANSTRPKVALGATPNLFVHLLAGHVYLAALLGENSFAGQSGAVLLAVALVGTVLLAYCFWKAPWQWRLFLAFCMLVFAASLTSPMASLSTPQWQMLEASPGVRYWFFPTLAFGWALVWLATSTRQEYVRIASIAALLTMVIGVTRDWVYPPFTDFHFPIYAQRFAAAPPGALLIAPIFPDGWTMRLTKKAPLCHTLPSGLIDIPRPGSQVSDSIVVGGWVTSSEGVYKLSIYIDRRLIQSVEPSVPRPDVDKEYPSSPIKNKGWDTRLDLSKISAGPHEIEVRAVQSGHCEADIGTVLVNRER